MKRLILVLCLICCPLAHTGCQTSPSTQSVAVRTLAAIGATAKAGMDACTQLLKGGHITLAEWERVAAFFDNRFQPVYTLAVNTLHGASTDSVNASPDLLKIAAEFAALVQTFSTRP